MLQLRQGNSLIWTGLGPRVWVDIGKPDRIQENLILGCVRETDARLT
jgi:hypothetical protein